MRALHLFPSFANTPVAFSASRGQVWLPIVVLFGATVLAHVSPAPKPLEETPVPVVAVPAKPAKEAWKRFATLENASATLSHLRLPGFNIQNERVPVIRVDGSEIAGKLPAALWVKLEQPGTAVLLVETNEGVFVKFLEEVSPGYISRCELDPYSFGTAGGKPAEIDVRSVAVKALWILQDAPVPLHQVPGWLAVAPPPDVPDQVPPVAAVAALN